MDAIILAGGLGTRLKAVVSDLPKPMASVNGIPFMSYILDYLISQEVNKIVLAVGYKWEKIRDYYGDEYRSVPLVYSVEEEPLGTGGGIKKAIRHVEGSHVYIINGDTYFNVDLKKLSEENTGSEYDLSLSLKPLIKFERYGSVAVEKDRVVKFEEKKYCEEGYINGGVYIARTTLLNNLGLPDKFSFETDFMQKYVGLMKFGAYISDGYFIDIGIPEDYERAQKELVSVI